MTSILLAGGPGSGKSTVSQKLRDRGLRSIDLDYGYARWEDRDGRAVAMPAAPDRNWLGCHHWNWTDDLLVGALEGCRERTTVLAGTAANQAGYLDRFELIMVLSISDATLAERLRDPTRTNVFGSTGDTAEWSRRWRRTVETTLARRGAIMIDAERPLDLVVADVIRTCSAQGHPIAPGVS